MLRRTLLATASGGLAALAGCSNDDASGVTYDDPEELLLDIGHLPGSGWQEGEAPPVDNGTGDYALELYFREGEYRRVTVTIKAIIFESQDVTAETLESWKDAAMSRDGMSTPESIDLGEEGYSIYGELHSGIGPSPRGAVVSFRKNNGINEIEAYTPENAADETAEEDNLDLATELATIALEELF